MKLLIILHFLQLLRKMMLNQLIVIQYGAVVELLRGQPGRVPGARQLRRHVHRHDPVGALGERGPVCVDEGRRGRSRGRHPLMGPQSGGHVLGADIHTVEARTRPDPHRQRHDPQTDRQQVSGHVGE